MAKLARIEGLLLQPPRILLLSTQAVVRFPFSPQSVIFVVGKHRLRKDDFEIAVDADFEGNVRPVTIRNFIWTEVRTNGLVLLGLALVVGWLLLADSKGEATTSINQMLVEANAIFISIFILFTASQNRDLVTTRRLVRDGSAYQYLQNDKYMAWTSIVSLLLAIGSTAVNTRFSTATTNIQVDFLQLMVSLSILPALMTTLALLLLVDCFLAVTHYYLKIMVAVVESKILADWIGVRKPKQEHSTDTDDR